MAIAFQYLIRDAKGISHIVDRRIRVYDVTGYIRMGQSAQEIAEDYRLPLAAVYEALAYAEEHPDEIAALRAAEDEAHERSLARVPAGLRADLEAVNSAGRASGRPLS